MVTKTTGHILGRRWASHPKERRETRPPFASHCTPHTHQGHRYALSNSTHPDLCRIKCIETPRAAAARVRFHLKTGSACPLTDCQFRQSLFQTRRPQSSLSAAQSVMNPDPHRHRSELQKLRNRYPAVQPSAMRQESCSDSA